MKRSIVLLLLAPGFLAAQNRSIAFEHGSFDEALNKARQEKKLVFVDCYTQWCMPCKQMAQYVFTQDSVADFFNARFVNLKLDMEKEGKEKVATYRVEAYPSFLLLDPAGRIVYKFVGGMPSDQFMAKVREGLAPRNKVEEYNRMYAEGNRSKELLREYIKLKIEMMETKEAKEIAAQYFDMLTPEERTSRENWFLFGQNRYTLYLSDIYSRNASYLADNWRSFAATVGRDTVEDKLGSIYRKIATYCLEGYYFKERAYDPADFSKFRRQLKGTELADKDQLLVLMDVAEAAGQKDTAKVTSLLAQHIGSFSPANQKIFLSYIGMIHFTARRFPQAAEVAGEIVRTSRNESMVKFGENIKKTAIQP